ncbi:sucrose-6-phosphate hydrolase [Paenibacillus sp. Marseille-Q4541]|uniref:glycoside hydrolase family 32 protein n=1 Tax=Paenibacillus sp. Marseille-Q4541 TaxID=2831522 RepID=UPI001BAE1D79|nr:sucrose-6-phosphate hydrolase [Paenibacillus sp. Marseille-Q4541]
MEWTREQRYRRLHEVKPTELEQLEKKVANSPWRQTFHIQPQTGLLNDPNGFSFYNGEYHLFYQWFPLGAVHGLKHWYHVSSPDLVNWRQEGTAIEPDRDFDSHGVYSGSGLEHDGLLYLMYTGNVRDKDWNRFSHQCMAFMDKEGKIKKFDSPVIPDIPEGYTDHFRDPKLWKQNDKFYAIIGAQRVNETGVILLYSSSDLKEWKLHGEIQTNLSEFGFMWECPDYFELDGQGILLFSPQGLEPQGDKYNNIYQSGYLVGDLLDVDSLEFEHGPFHELDHGFDFYAPQTMVDDKGRRLLIGWMGLPEIEYPTDKEGWAHCLTIPRVLHLQEGQILQQPPEEFINLRKNNVSIKDELQTDEIKSYSGIQGEQYELICDWMNVDAREFGLELRTGSEEEEKTVISYHTATKKLTLDRTLSGQPVGHAYGTTRSCTLEDTNKLRLRIFVDTSSVEIFVNEGQYVFTARIFPKETSTGVRFYTKGGRAAFEAEKWDLQSDSQTV